MNSLLFGLKTFRVISFAVTCLNQHELVVRQKNEYPWLMRNADCQEDSKKMRYTIEIFI
jgi:hypothetical protein